MLCADRGNVDHWPVQSRLRLEPGYDQRTGTGGADTELNRQLGFRGDGVIPSDDEDEPVGQGAFAFGAVAAAAPAVPVAQAAAAGGGGSAPAAPSGSLPSDPGSLLSAGQFEEDSFWNTLLELNDCPALENADNAAAAGGGAVPVGAPVPAQHQPPAAAAAAAAPQQHRKRIPTS